MWVQLLAAKQLDQDGLSRTYYPGDWVDVGKQTALRWIADNEARTFAPGPEIAIGPDAGVVVPPGREAAIRQLADMNLGLTVTVGEPRLTHERTLLWDGLAPLRIDLLGVGFGFLDRWHVAAPLDSYERLVADIGTPEEREQTVRVIRDGRVPAYDPRVVFIRRCFEGQSFLDAWLEIAPGGRDDRLQMIEALYVTRPLVLALPTSWIRQRGGQR